MVQYQEHPNLPLHQRRFNAALRSSRSTVERCIGVLKKRWACLKGLRTEPEKTTRIIAACACLHNLCLGDPLPEEIEGEEMDVEDDIEQIDDIGDNPPHFARARRDAVALTFVI